MIKAINFPNQYQINNKLNLKESAIKEVSNNDNFELADYKTGQAILARNAVSFKSSSISSIITTQIEKPEKTNFPDIHVFEYKNTNLKAFINIDNNIKTSNKSFLEQPQIIIQILNNLTPQERNINAELLIKQIIQSKLQEKSDNILNNILDDERTFCSFSEWAGENVIQNLHNLNDIVFNLKITDSDIENAQKILGNNSLKKISIDYLQEYYKKLQNNITANAFVTVSKDYFENNKNIIFTELNKNINIKMNKNDSEDTNILRERLIKTFTTTILNANKEFSSEFYTVRNNNSYQIISKNNFDKNKYSKILNDVINEDMQYITIESKKSFVQEISNILTKEELPLIKNITLAKWGNNLEKLEEIIDSFNENDIKQNINEFFIKQIPEVENI